MIPANVFAEQALTLVPVHAVQVVVLKKKPTLHVRAVVALHVAAPVEQAVQALEAR